MVNLLNSPYGISKTILFCSSYTIHKYTIFFYMFHKFFKIKVGSVN